MSHYKHICVGHFLLITDMPQNVVTSDELMNKNRTSTGPGNFVFKTTARPPRGSDHTPYPDPAGHPHMKYIHEAETRCIWQERIYIQRRW